MPQYAVAARLRIVKIWDLFSVTQSLAQMALQDLEGYTKRIARPRDNLTGQPSKLSVR